MAETREGASRPEDTERGTQPGLAGGPGPTPPGFGDNTPRILPDGSPGHPPPAAVEPKDDEAYDREGAPVEHRGKEQPSP